MRKNPKETWVERIFISVAMLAIGFGISQITLASDVHSNIVRMNRVELDIQELKKQDELSNARFETRMGRIQDLIIEQTKISTDLISIIKLQNQMSK